MPETLDLQPPVLTILADKGKTLSPTFYMLDEDYGVISLNGFKARMQVRVRGALQNGWDLTTENGGLAIVTGTAVVNDSPIQDAWGVQLQVSASVTEGATWSTGQYDIELIDTSLSVLPFLQGTISLAEEVTK